MTLDVNAYYAFGLPFYAALVAAETAIRRRRGQAPLPFARTAGSVATGVGLVIVGLALGPALAWLYDHALVRLALVRWPAGSFAPWVLGVLVGDLCYYWHHRAGHTVAALWAIHVVHHQSDQFDSGVALRSPWFADLYSAPFYALAPLMGIPAAPFFIGISLVTLYSLTIHALAFDRPGFFLFVTPRTHIAHHAIDPRFENHNYGAFLTIWDRLFGTYVEVPPGERLVLGIRDGYETHDGALSNWLPWARLIALARQTPRWPDKLRTFLMAPGWLPPGARPSPRAPARDEAAIRPHVRTYVLAQLFATIALAAYVLWLRDAHPAWLLTSGSALVLWLLSTLGGLLDGRAGARATEARRLIATAAFALGLALTGRTAAGTVVALGVATALRPPRSRAR